METAKISMALVKCQAACGSAHKSGRNEFDKYSYANLEDYCTVIRKPMADNGLSLSVNVTAINRLPERATSSGKKEYPVEVFMSGLLIHESGEQMSFNCYGEGQDRSDKAIYKAITGAKKYLIANIFNIPTTDDCEKDSDVEREKPVLIVGEAIKVQPKISAPIKPPTKPDVPTLRDTNLQLAGKVTALQYDAMKDLLVKNKVSGKQWGLWLKANYDATSISEIKQEQYAEIFNIIKNDANQIINFGK